MTAPRPGPKLSPAAIVVMDPTSAAVLNLLPFQYIPEKLSRTLQPDAAKGEGRDRGEALRLHGCATETIQVVIELDATDWLEHPDADPVSSVVSRFGLLPHLALLENLQSPTLQALKDASRDATRGIIEISPMQAPLTVFMCNRWRPFPVQINELSINEDAYDAMLNPIRVQATLSMRVLTINDLLPDQAGAQVFLQCLTQRTTLARQIPAAPAGFPTAIGV